MRATEFKYCTGATTPPTLTKNIKVRWLRPTPGSYKLNTDGSFPEKDQRGGIGGVIRNSNGDWVLSYSKKIDAYNHTHTELSALEHGLQLAANQHLIPIENETDSIEVIEFLNKIFPIY